jgi:hypothetical protein
MTVRVSGQSAISVPTPLVVSNNGNFIVDDTGDDVLELVVPAARVAVGMFLRAAAQFSIQSGSTATFQLLINGVVVAQVSGSASANPVVQLWAQLNVQDASGEVVGGGVMSNGGLAGDTTGLTTSGAPDTSGDLTVVLRADAANGGGITVEYALLEAVEVPA